MFETTTYHLFHGKILVFGEYSVLYGSKALVIPYLTVSARLTIPVSEVEIPGVRESNLSLRDFAGYLQNNVRKLPGLDIGRFKGDLDQGLYFHSSIPLNYGVGSSGAICAAVYDEYGPGKKGRKLTGNSNDLHLVHEALSAMESYYHGQSSGIDPLCIFYEQPLVVHGKEKILPWHTYGLTNEEIRMFLLDTGRMGRTGDHVKEFGKKLMNPGLRRSFKNRYVPLLNQIVDRFIQGNPEFDQILRLSLLQLEFFEKMIPENYYRVWQYGLRQGSYACKLCGSGGGGYILGFTDDFTKAQNDLAQFKLAPIILEIS